VGLQGRGRGEGLHEEYGHFGDGHVGFFGVLVVLCVMLANMSLLVQSKIGTGIRLEHSETVQTYGHYISATNVTSLFLLLRILLLSALGKSSTYVQPNTSNTPNLLLRQRAQELADGLLLASWLAGTKHRLAAEHIHLDILAIVSSNADIDRRVNRLANEDGG